MRVGTLGTGEPCGYERPQKSFSYKKDFWEVSVSAFLLQSNITDFERSDADGNQ